MVKHIREEGYGKSRSKSRLAGLRRLKMNLQTYLHLSASCLLPNELPSASQNRQGNTSVRITVSQGSAQPLESTTGQSSELLIG